MMNHTTIQIFFLTPAIVWVNHKFWLSLTCYRQVVHRLGGGGFHHHTTKTTMSGWIVLHRQYTEEG